MTNRETPACGRLRRSCAAGGAAPSPDNLEPLSQYRLQIGDGAPLQQHVPVAARRLDLFGCGRLTGRREGDRTADTAFPGRGKLSFSGEGHGKVVTLGTVECDLLSRGEVGVAIVFVAR